jgi:hypothetical protein
MPDIEVKMKQAVEQCRLWCADIFMLTVQTNGLTLPTAQRVTAVADYCTRALVGGAMARMLTEQIRLAEKLPEPWNEQGFYHQFAHAVAEVINAKVELGEHQVHCWDVKIFTAKSRYTPSQYCRN